MKRTRTTTMREGNGGCGLVMTHDAGALGSASVVDASRDEEKDLETASTPAATPRPMLFVTPCLRLKSLAALAEAETAVEARSVIL